MTPATDEELIALSEPTGLPSIDLSRRVTGLVVAVLACLLNYVLLFAVSLWMFGQIKTIHDPYEIDALLLSPLVLQANGWTPLHLAAARGDLPLVTTLLDNGASIDQLNGNRRTALYEAAKRGRTEVVTLLLDRGANPNARGKSGYTPLLVAAEHGHAETITVLLSLGADHRVLCTCGDSALHRAVRNGHLAATQILLAQGISVNRKSHGETALEIAQHDGDQELIDLLRAHGGRDFSQAKAYRAEGVAYQKKGQPNNALFAYAKALSLDPDDDETYYGRGTALLQKDEPDEALIAFEAAIRLNPTYFEAYHATASVHTARQQWGQALALWDQFLARQPQHGRAHFERAVVKRAQGDSTGFLEGLQRACSLGHEAAC
ncbi:MAG: ankyrin repeat domain-containing protein [Nitrospira sp.]|nr:ankyrin repeat domain-containing protein [Nitrospira sp.]